MMCGCDAENSVDSVPLVLVLNISGQWEDKTNDVAECIADPARKSSGDSLLNSSEISKMSP
jgi:hypothetical protein